ncbi:MULTISPECIES: hypothetical protein [unclassified Halomonas]|uniref:hypothetical protein n=1 Tax=unclassified Halomonas TaxID=2609666 RepID=UPI000550D1B3|nr:MULTISPECIES: hypothetical protein [unclassified Halomonas]
MEINYIHCRIALSVVVKSAQSVINRSRSSIKNIHLYEHRSLLEEGFLAQAYFVKERYDFETWQCENRCVKRRYSLKVAYRIQLLMAEFFCSMATKGLKNASLKRDVVWG